MKKRIYVVSGTHNEFMAYKLNKNDPENTNYIYVSKPEILRGMRDPKGVFYGSWRNRSDILEIVNHLRLYTTTDNPTLDRIWAEVWKSSSHAQVHNLAIKKAAQELADEIDRQVLAGALYNRYDYKIPATGDIRHNSYIDKAEIFNGSRWSEL